MPADPSLDHLERTFGDSYRKEIDQEENVWRSLPFFAATLALQVAALAQIRDWFGMQQGGVFWAAAGLLGAAAAATLCALVCLARSISPAELRYVSREPELLRYAEAVRAQAEADGASPALASDAALAAVRATLVEQYALAADNNRAVNQRRARWRNAAGLATLCSVLVFVALVALAVVSGLHQASPARRVAEPHAEPQAPAGTIAAAPLPPGRTAGGGGQPGAAPAGPPAHAGGP
ncbi:hypothetical protein [Roseomonas sp. BN140053]|uniref:hypothetical protein n=1 Tax=Roseomonas sp. BN140053 TaxID=3391898 RepID=UPI0039ED1A0B